MVEEKALVNMNPLKYIDYLCSCGYTEEEQIVLIDDKIKEIKRVYNERRKKSR